MNNNSSKFRSYIKFPCQVSFDAKMISEVKNEMRFFFPSSPMEAQGLRLFAANFGWRSRISLPIAKHKKETL